MGEETSQGGLQRRPGSPAREPCRSPCADATLPTTPLLLRAGLRRHGLPQATDEGNHLPRRMSALGRARASVLRLRRSTTTPSAGWQIHAARGGKSVYAGRRLRSRRSAELLERFCQISERRLRLRQRSARARDFSSCRPPILCCWARDMNLVIAAVARIASGVGRDVAPTKIAFRPRPEFRHTGSSSVFGSSSRVLARPKAPASSDLEPMLLSLSLITADPKTAPRPPPYSDAAPKDEDMKPVASALR